MDIEEQYDKVYRYCYLRIRHQQTAEDITQEAFLRFLEVHSYREIGKCLAYLYTIARNLCTDYYRKKKEMPLPQDYELAGEDEQDGLIQTMELRKAVKQLKEEEQELILLRYVNDVPINDIGRIMGISRFAVYRRLRICLKQLKEELGKEGGLLSTVVRFIFFSSSTRLMVIFSVAAVRFLSGFVSCLDIT